jgi:hypothetical protein
MKTNAFVKLVTVMAVSLGLATVACSGGEPEYMGSCMQKTEGGMICTDYFGEDMRGGAEKVCKEFAKPTHFTTTKLLTGRCPAEGKTETFVHEYEGYDARDETSNYEYDIKYMEAAK